MHSTSRTLLAAVLDAGETNGLRESIGLRQQHAEVIAQLGAALIKNGLREHHTAEEIARTWLFSLKFIPLDAPVS